MTEVRRGACHLCEAMCGLNMEVEGDQVLSVRGAEDDPLSRGHLCPKALALPDVRDDPDRLRRPVRRTSSGEWEELDWDAAFDLVAHRLADIRRDHGADAVASYLGNPVVHSLGAATHAIPFVELLGTRNRYSASSVDQLPLALTCRLLYGNQWLTPIPDIDRTRYFLVFGANPAASNGSMMSAPGIVGRIRDMRARGGRMVLFDPRRTESARLADEHQFIRPGTDAALLLSLVRLVLTDAYARPAAYVDGVDDVRRAVDAFTPEAVEPVTGVPAETIRRIAAEFAAADGAACYGRIGVSTQEFGALCQWAIQLLNLLTGNLDRPGGTMLATPAVDPVKQADPGRHRRWRSRVRGLPEFAGELPVSTLTEEITTPGTGQVRAFVAIAGNPVLSTPGGAALGEALSQLDFMVAVDFYVNETTRHADVILPPTDALERDHYDLVLHLYAVRNTARFMPAVFPKPAESRHDWEIFGELGRRYLRRRRALALRQRMMLAMSPTRIVDLGLRMGPHPLTLRSLRRTPAGVDLGPPRPCLPGRLATKDKRVHAAPRVLLDDVERAVATLLAGPETAADAAPEGPGLRLIGRRHLRSNNSWMHNVPRLVKGKRRDQLLMHPGDLAARGIADGARVELCSDAGTVEVDVQATTDLMPGTVSLPHGFGHAVSGVRLETATQVGGASANDVTDPARVDEASGTAVLNGVPVEVRPVNRR